MGSNNLRWWEETEEMMATKGRRPRPRRRAPRGRTYMWQKCIRKTDGSHCPASRSSTIPTSPPSLLHGGSVHGGSVHVSPSAS